MANKLRIPRKAFDALFGTAVENVESGPGMRLPGDSKLGRDCDRVVDEEAPKDPKETAQLLGQNKRLGGRSLNELFGEVDAKDGGPGSGPKAGSKTEHAIRKEKGQPIKPLSEKELAHVFTNKAFKKYHASRSPEQIAASEAVLKDPSRKLGSHPYGLPSRDAGTSEGAKKAAATRGSGGKRYAKSPVAKDPRTARNQRAFQAAFGRLRSK